MKQTLAIDYLTTSGGGIVAEIVFRDGRRWDAALSRNGKGGFEVGGGFNRMDGDGFVFMCFRTIDKHYRLADTWGMSVAVRQKQGRTGAL